MKQSYIGIHEKDIFTYNDKLYIQRHEPIWKKKEYRIFSKNDLKYINSLQIKKNDIMKKHI